MKEDKVIAKRVADKKWFTVAEVADYLGFPPMTVYRLVKSGRLGARNIGLPSRRKPTLRVSRETLVAAIQQVREGLPVSVS
jgi:excisionase family DNA binding protein